VVQFNLLDKEITISHHGGILFFFSLSVYPFLMTSLAPINKITFDQLTAVKEVEGYAHVFIIEAGVKW
jgi:hypothetical protein